MNENDFSLTHDSDLGGHLRMKLQSLVYMYLRN